MSDRRASAQGGRDTGPRAHSWSAVGPGSPELVLPRWQLPDWGPGQPRPWAGRRLRRLLGGGTYLLGSARPAPRVGRGASSVGSHPTISAHHARHHIIKRILALGKAVRTSESTEKAARRGPGVGGGWGCSLVPLLGRWVTGGLSTSRWGEPSAPALAEVPVPFQADSR